MWAAGLTDYEVRDLNDEINKLMREKRHWENQIVALGGANYRRNVAMMDDEGRNRAQFKQAGIEAVVDRFVRRRLYDGLEQNGNWPQPSVGNSCALWLWWMFTTRGTSWSPLQLHQLY